MELLNSIWTILTTPNELNTQIITFPCTFIEAFITMLLFLTILDVPASKKRKIFYCIFFPIISTIIDFFIPSPFNTFTHYVFGFIFIILIFKMDSLKALLSLIIPLVVFGVISTLILTPYLMLLNINAEQLSCIPIYNLGYLLCLYIISSLLICILKFKNIKINIPKNTDLTNKNTILINFVFGVFNIFVQSCIVFYYIDNLPIIITFLSCISLLIYFGISIYSLTREMKLTLTTKKLESAEEYNRTLHILHDNVRGFKHDFDNTVTTIGGYIRTNDIEGLKNYYLQLEDDCQRVNNLYLLNPEVVNNPRHL